MERCGGVAKHCKAARIADDAPDNRQLGLVIAAALIATRQSIAAVNRFYRSSSHFIFGEWE
ncbi:hypothetical protein [Xanthomonas cannabis]|uniref:hypothetical protein n=1 Tax=Xanthomonas cannabis TaxID=1885674 RepID=UPI0013012D47|nr:hypothetical protein [Xanthomonas cannabis]